MGGTKYGEHRCEDCGNLLSERDIEAYSIEVDGIKDIDPQTGRFVPRQISIPAVCEECADVFAAEAVWGKK